MTKMNVYHNTWLSKVIAEFGVGFEHLATVVPAVTLLGSARFAAEHPYYALTEHIARALSQAGFSVLTGGGPGIMEAANKGAFTGNTLSVGLNVALPHEQIANPYQDITLNFQHLFIRKIMLIHYALAYVVLPGGFGTLDELTEILTLMQTEKMAKKPLILVQSTFWNGLLHWLKGTLVDHQTINATDLTLLSCADQPEEIIAIIRAYHENNAVSLMCKPWYDPSASTPA